MKSKNFIIDLVIYPFDIMISIGESDKKIKNKLRKSGINKSELYLAEYDEIGAANFVLFSSGQSLIRIKQYPKTPYDFGTIQHEIFHVASTILRRMGLKLKIGSSDEAYAYLIGYITTEVYKKIKP